jgi:hypothetical protein
MLAHDELVLTLPAHRCVELVAAGRARPFDAGKGRPMKEWITLPDAPESWPTLADEALAFVRAAKH